MGSNAISKATQELITQAAQLQKNGIIEDDITVAGMQQLATFQLTNKEIGIMAEGMDDLTAQKYGVKATEENIVSIANMIGKTMDGNTGALKKAGVTFTKEQEKIIKNGNKMQKAITIASVLQDNVGGVNKALSETDFGTMQKAKNLIDDSKETIGSKITPLWAQALKEALPYGEKLLSYIDKTIDKVTPQIEDWIKNDLPGDLKSISHFAEKMIDSFVSNLPALQKFINTIGKVAEWLSNMSAYDTVFFNNKPTITEKPKIKPKTEKTTAAKLAGYANGDVVKKPTLALIAEAGYAETVVPNIQTKRSQSLAYQAASATGLISEGYNANITYSPTFNIGKNANEEDISKLAESERQKFFKFAEELTERNKRQSFGKTILNPAGA